VILKLQLHHKYKKIFLSPNSKFEENSKVDIVLSPQLYWCRIFEIPVQKVKKAQKALPMLFEDVLPPKKFEYWCRKIADNSYMAFAYNNSEIIEAIEKSGLNISQVNNVYLAQGQMMKYKNFQIGEEYYQYCNNVLVNVPYKLHNNYEQLSFEIDNSLKIDKVNIQLYANFIKRKYLESLFILLFMTTLLGVFQLIQYNKEVIKNQNYLTRIKHEYNLPQSTIQFKSILNNLKQEELLNKDFKQKFISLLSYVNETNNVVIEKIDYKNNKLIFLYSNTDEKSLEKYLKQKIEKFILSIQNNQVQIEVDL